jgi:hypothetical protein
MRRIPSGAKAQGGFVALAARLKPSPFKATSFPQPVKAVLFELKLLPYEPKPVRFDDCNHA